MMEAMKMYETLKLYDEIVLNYFKTIVYLKNKLNKPMEYREYRLVNDILNKLEIGSDKK